MDSSQGSGGSIPEAVPNLQITKNKDNGDRKVVEKKSQVDIKIKDEKPPSSVKKASVQKGQMSLIDMFGKTSSVKKRDEKLESKADFYSSYFTKSKADFKKYEEWSQTHKIAPS